MMKKWGREAQAALVVPLAFGEGGTEIQNPNPGHRGMLPLFQRRFVLVNEEGHYGIEKEERARQWLYFLLLK